MQQLVVDCDAGTDDAQALLMAAARADTVRMRAVTSVFGNSTIQNTTRNVCRVLNFCGLTDTPVYRGADRALLGQPGSSDGFHGNDGMGDIPNQYLAGSISEQSESAAEALVRMSKETQGDPQGDLVLVALGPLTNLALALRLDPDFGKRLQHCYIMGGNTTGVGNITSSAEFNFYSDPVAAKVVLEELACPITVAALEVCQENFPSWEWYEQLTALDTDTARFIKDMDKVMVHNIKHRGMENTRTNYCAWDQLAMAAVLDNKVAMETKSVYATVETAECATKGQMVVDWHGKMNKKENVCLIHHVDKERYHGLMMDTARHQFAKKA